MKKHFMRWFLISFSLTLLMFSRPFSAKDTSAVPCRPMPEVCRPETEFPPCQPSRCLGTAPPQTPRTVNQ